MEEKRFNNLFKGIEELEIAELDLESTEKRFLRPVAQPRTLGANRNSRSVLVPSPLPLCLRDIEAVVVTQLIDLSAGLCQRHSGTILIMLSTPHLPEVSEGSESGIPPHWLDLTNVD